MYHPFGLAMRQLAVLLLATALLLSGCGTKGPLYLPPPAAKQDPNAKQKGQ